MDIDIIFAFINTLGEVAGHLTIPFTKHEFEQILQKQIDFRCVKLISTREHRILWMSWSDDVDVNDTSNGFVLIVGSKRTTCHDLGTTSTTKIC